MRQPLVAEVKPEVPADRAAPAKAVMEVLAAPVPAAAVPAVIVPTVAVAGVPVVFGLRIFGVAAQIGAALGAHGNRPRHAALDPALVLHFGALRQNQQRAGYYAGAIDRDAQAGR